MGFLAYVAVLAASLTLVGTIGRRANVLWQSIAALALQFLLGSIFWAIFGPLGDGIRYDQLALEFAESLDTNHSLGAAWSDISALGEGKRTTVLLAGGVYWMLGHEPVAYFGLMASLLALVPALAALTVRWFGFAASAQWAAWIAVLATPFTFWSPWITREGTAFLLLMASTTLFAAIYSGKSPLLASIAFLALALALYFVRSWLLAVLAAGTVVSLLLASTPRFSRENSEPKARCLMSRALIAATAVIICLSLFVQAPATGFLEPKARTVLLSQNSADNQTLAVDRLIVSNPVLETLLNLPSATFGPLPWNWVSVEWVLVGLDGLQILIVTVVLLAQGLLVKRTRPILAILLAASAPLILGASHFHANYGITSRVRAHYLVIVLPLFAVAAFNLWGTLRRTMSKQSKVNRSYAYSPSSEHSALKETSSVKSSRHGCSRLQEDCTNSLLE